MIHSTSGRVLLGIVLAVVLLAAFLWALQRRKGYDRSTVGLIENRNSPAAVNLGQPSPSAASSDAPPSATSSPSMSPAQISPGVSPTRVPESLQSPTPMLEIPGYVGTLELIVPVAGVRPDQLQDTFKDARVEGRVHDAIDIPAPAGTPVLAATDGEIIKLFQSERGGTTIYQLSPDKKLIFYYAHLQRYAEGLTERKRVRQGDVIAYVGDTGNAGAGNYHLHFSISIVPDPKRYWEGTNINPYPLLRR
jgi:murein DD-endopeptidase MepM/ murein hydrolase activator NlpD